MGLTKEALRLFLAVTALILTAILTNPLQQGAESNSTQLTTEVNTSPRATASSKKAPKGQKFVAYKIGKKS